MASSGRACTNNTGVKTCTKCGVEKPLSEFHRRKIAKDGRNSHCKECRCEYVRTHSDHYRDRHRELKRKWCEENKTKLEKYHQEYREANKAKRNAYHREYCKANRDKINEYRRERYASDSLFALAIRYTVRTNKALKGIGFSKRAKTKEMLGCTWEELLQHLEAQFLDGMSWGNRDKWHIDHIVPLASAKTEEELYSLCHYTNLQPLWAEDNIKKGAKN